MSPLPRISQYMTPAPKTIGMEQTLEDAGEYMRKLRVRHLPVTRDGKPVGIVSERDIRLAMAVAHRDAQNMKVEAILTSNPYFTSPDDPINKAARHLANEDFGCVLVVDRGALVGIFTTTDALHALADIFERDFSTSAAAL